MCKNHFYSHRSRRKYYQPVILAIRTAFFLKNDLPFGNFYVRIGCVIGFNHMMDAALPTGTI